MRTGGRAGTATRPGPARAPAPAGTRAPIWTPATIGTFPRTGTPARAGAPALAGTPASEGTAPGSVTSMSKLSGLYSRTTWQRSAPECLTTLVSDSCTMRNAERSRLAGRLRGSPIRSTVTVTPAPAVRSTSRSRFASPGAGASGAVGRNRGAPGRSAGAARSRPWPVRPRPLIRSRGVPFTVRPARRRLAGGQFRVRRRDVPVRLAEHAQHPLHLAQRLPAHRLDRAQRRPGLIGLAVEHVLAEPGLHGDHGHAVRHHVVQFPGDPEPLPGHRVAGRPVPDRRHVGPPLLHQVPDHPGDGQHQGVGDRVAGPLPVEVQHYALHEQQGQRGAEAGQRDTPAAGRRDQEQHQRQREERATGDLPAGSQGHHAGGQHDDQGPDRDPAPDGDRDGQGDRQHGGERGVPRGQHPEQGPAAHGGVEERPEDHYAADNRRGVVQRCPEPPPQPRAPRWSGCSAHQLTVTPQGAPGRPPAVVRCRADPGYGAARVRPWPDGGSHPPG